MINSKKKNSRQLGQGNKPFGSKPFGRRSFGHMRETSGGAPVSHLNGAPVSHLNGAPVGHLNGAPVGHKSERLVSEAVPEEQVSPSSHPTVPTNDDIEDYLASVEYRVTEELPGKIDCLLRLKDSVTDPNNAGCFDNEDVSWIDLELAALNQQLESATQEWKHRKYLYHDVLVPMEDMLETRQKVLNSLNTELGLFSQQPKLTQLFAVKQAELMSQTSKLKEQIYVSPVPTGGINGSTGGINGSAGISNPVASKQ